MNWLKIIKIIVSILIIAGIVWGIRYFFYTTPAGTTILSALFPSSEQGVGGINGANKANNTGEAAELKLQLLTNDPIFDYWVSSTTSNIFYANESGQILKISGGTEVMNNSQTINKLRSIRSSFDGTYAVAEFNYPGFPLFSILNTVTGSWQLLPADTIAATWAPHLNELAYMDSKALRILTLGTNKTREIMKFSQKELRLSWTTTNKIIMATLPASQLNTRVWTIDLVKKTILSEIQETGAVTHWSKDGSLGIKLTSINGVPKTNLIDQSGSVLSEFTFVTMPEKCVFGIAKIYCAIPKNIPTQTILPDDFYKKSVYFDDLLHLIDLSSGGFSQISTDSQELIDAEHLELMGDKLLFKNRLDGKLYSLVIGQ